MRLFRNISLCAGVLLASAAVGQTQDLPSAPSANVAPAPRQTPPPAKQTEQKPATDTAPVKKPIVLQSLEDRKKQQAPVQQNTPSAQKTTTPAKPSSTDTSLAPPPDSEITDPAKPPQPAAGAAHGPDDPETIIKKVEEVNVIFTVTDKHGKFIKDLKKEDFAVLDDKKPASAIRGFSAQTNLPLRVGLLVDASNSIRDRFKFEQEAAVEFLNQIIRSSDEAFVVGFDSNTELEQDFTNSTELLSKGVRVMRPGGGTALYDAVYRACKEKLMMHPDSTPVRRAIILLSDGDDNQSRVTREEAIEMAQRAEVVIYAISTNLADKGRGDRELERMATATGGRAFFPFKLQEVSNAFSDIQEELRSQYAIAYKPADFTADGRYRSIDISARDGKLKVRSRRGYFAPKS